MLLTEGILVEQLRIKLSDLPRGWEETIEKHRKNELSSTNKSKREEKKMETAIVRDAFGSNT